jgi:hypothetical protein
VPRKLEPPLGDWAKEPATFTMPRPISHRLDLLVEQAKSEGERTHRNELVAALIQSAPEDGVALSRLIRDYRKASATSAVAVGGRRPTNVLSLPRQRPGPRKDHSFKLA